MGVPEKEVHKLPYRNLFYTGLAVFVAVAIAVLLTFLFTKSAISDSDNDPFHHHNDDSDNQGPSADELRLQKNIEPLSYDLHIKTYLPGYVPIPPARNLTFDAELIINMHILEETDKLELNAMNITIEKALLYTTQEEVEIGIEARITKDDVEKVIFVPERALATGENITIKIAYQGLIGTSLGGLYQSKYTDKDGNEKIVAVTQMEPTDARKMVPCFDEPAFKATWSVSVTHPRGTKAISNGDQRDTTEVEEDWMHTAFHTTPKMSSYLLAIMVSEFTSISGKTKRGTLFRIWSRPEATDDTYYALESGINCLEFYEDLFGIAFPLPKQDMVAVPDFSAGAMENWGLITYREKELLYNKALYSPFQKRRVATVVAHELAHQWFGNLVTMNWWSELWLNEGFASLMEAIGTDHISNGTFRMAEWFMSDAQDAVMGKDALPTSHPLSFKIEKATEVQEAFDTITYKKGASVINMIREVMGREAFDKGIKAYLTENSYANAIADDLWDALNAHVDESTKGADGQKLNIPNFARQWTLQMGFPVLSVKRRNDSTVIVEQSRFLSSNDTLEKKKYRNPEFDYKWDVPVWYLSDVGTQKFAWVPRDSPLILSSSADLPPILNYDSRAYFRVSYEAEDWKRIGKRLKQNYKAFSVITRARLLSDAFAMAEAGLLDYDVVFDLSEYIDKETEYLPWNSLLTGLSKIRNYFGTEPESIFVKRYLRKILHDRYNNASIAHVAETYLDDGKFAENVLESRVIQSFCSANSADCQRKLIDHFNKEFLHKCKKEEEASKCSNVTVPLRYTVYCEAVKGGDSRIYDRIFNAYLKESVQLEKNTLLYALSCTRDISTLKSLLRKSVDRSQSDFRLQDVSTMYGNVAKNPIGSSIIFDFILDNWDHIYNGLKVDHTLLTAVVKSCTNDIRTEREIRELVDFASGPEQRRVNAFNEQIAAAKQRTAWIAKHLQQLADYFRTHS